MRLIEMPTTTPGSEPPPAEGRVIFATREPREVRPHEQASFPLTGHVARLTRLGQSRPTRRAANLWTIGFWHPHCVPLELRPTEEGTAMAKIMGALITAIFVAAALLEWVAMRR